MFNFVKNIEKHIEAVGFLTIASLLIHLLFRFFPVRNKIGSSEIFIIIPGQYSFYTRSFPEFDRYSQCKDPILSLHDSIVSSSESEFCRAYEVEVNEIGTINISSLNLKERAYFYSSNRLEAFTKFIANIFGVVTLLLFFILFVLMRPFRPKPLWTD